MQPVPKAISCSGFYDKHAFGIWCWVITTDRGTYVISRLLYCKQRSSNLYSGL